MTTYHIESFDGTGNATEFIRNFETLSSTWTDVDRCLKFSQYLKGPAVPWMEFVRGGGTLREKLLGTVDTNKWADMRKLFLEEFSRNNGIEWFVTIQGPDEPGSAFLFRMLNLYNCHAKLVFKDSILIEILISKLNNRYLSEVKKEGPKSLKEIKEMFKFIDEREQAKEGSCCLGKEEDTEETSRQINKMKRRICY
jgi:hypothetical protein